MSLPSAYQEVEYIESSGTQYINTSIKLNNTNSIELKANLTGITSGGSWDKLYGGGDDGSCLFLQWNTGDNGSGGDRKMRMVNYSNAESYRKYVDSISAIVIGITHIYKQTNTAFYIDGVLQGTCASSTFTQNIGLNIFANANSNGTGRQKSCYKLYYMKIYNSSNDVVYDFVPCYRKSDNVIGLYDLVNDTFYTNSGTGTFTKGPNVVPPTPKYKLHGAIQTFHHKWYNWRDDYQEVKFIQSSGTQYIDTQTFGTDIDTVEMSFAFPTLPSAVVNAFGNRENGTAISGVRIENTNEIRPYFGDNIDTGISLTANTKFKVKTIYASGSQTVYIDDVLKNTGSLSWTRNNTYSNYIFGLNNNGSLQYSGSFKLYDCKLYNGNTLVRDFIPCYKRSNGEIGLYDLVEGKFYANAGTGTFTKGPDTYEGEIAPTENTLFLLRNNGEITDHSNYNHNMNWYGTEAYDLLNNGRKVLNFDGSNISYSDIFNESINKTAFTLHCRAKLKSGTTEDNIVGRCGRAKSDSATSDRRGLRLQRDSGYSTYYILAGPNSTNRVSTGNTGGINPGTSEFVLMTATVDGGTYKIYKNGSLVQTYSGSTIRGGSSTGTRFYMGGAVYSDGTKWSSTLSYSYVGETILEDRVRTATEIADYYNAFKSDYVELTLKTPSEIAALITTGDFGQTDFSAALAELNAHPKNYYRQFLSDNNLYTSYGKSNVMGNGNGSAYTKSAQIKTATYTVVLRYNESTELWDTYRYGGGNPSFDV